ncbi:hypothetical protein [Mesorhizobium sp.]|uniref:hypothetical protein n=1 Tax=Mesorhizobium sp. TaxID=1871066 RepID=UPI000FE60853|nr:hypothetical protein [Mesorhizobium sp.]RWB34747.1 MAG: hypothetical protein EOQ41_08435 [Mesorhizobium sp.]RWD46850.1 MAG: hypothetical protein EOS35_07545 [Mesorhizobium sp.]TIT15215.1 MAG: hypothetical protein E5W85_09140 [Mesorhizobium sp.]
MMNKCSMLIFAFSVAVANVSPANAFKLKDVVKDIGNVLKQAPKIINPITTPINIVTGKQNPLKIGDFIKQQGQALGSITESVQNITNTPTKAIDSLISKVAGDEVKIFYQIYSGNDRLLREFSFTAAQAGTQVLQGNDPLVAVGITLAAALRAAHKEYEGKVKPLPQEVITLLSPIIPPEILSKTQYGVGKFDLTIPGIVNSFHAADAVTLDDFIIFAEEPDFDDISILELLSHELFHIKQYTDWGIDGFAYNYVKNHRAVEEQAIAAGSFARSYIDQVAQGRLSGPKITFQSATAFTMRAVDTPLGQASVLEPADSKEQNYPTTALKQPVYTNPPASTDFEQVCAIYGERLLIAKNGDIIAPMRGNIILGKRTSPQDPRCFQDLRFPQGTHMCVFSNGSVFAGGFTQLGQCGRCQPGLC